MALTVGCAHASVRHPAGRDPVAAPDSPSGPGSSKQPLAEPFATKYQAVEVYRRTPQGWAIYQSYGPGDEIELTSLGVRFPLAALYKNAGVLEAMEDLEGEV